MQRNARKLAAASLIVMAGFVLSRISGLARNVVIARQFGTGRDYEAFLAAITVPDLVFQILAGGAVGAAFIPVFKSYVSRGEDDQAWHLTSTVISLAVLATGTVALVLAVFARPIAELIVPAWPAEDKDLTATLMRPMLISPVIFAASGFAISVLNSFQRFALTALAPIAYNATIVAAALVFQPLGIEGVAIGAAAGAGLHLLVQVPGLIGQRMRFRPSLDLGHAGVREVIRLMGPRMIGLALPQVAQLMNVVLASYLVLGSIAFLSNAWLLMLTPLVLAMAISTAVFPTLAEDSALDRTREVRDVFLLAFRSILFLTIPMAIGLAIVAEPLIRLLFESDKFTAESARGTADAVGFYAIGLTGHAAVEIVARVFYAVRDTRTPVLVAVGTFGLNVVLSVLLMQTALNYLGLALASSLAVLAEAAILTRLLGRRLDGLDVRALVGTSMRSLAAAVLMGAAVAALPRWLEERLTLPTSLELVLVIGIVALLGAIIYLGAAYVLRVEEPRILLRLVRSRA